MYRCCSCGVLVRKTRARRKQCSTAPGVTASLFHGTCALLLGVVLSASAFAQEVWNPYSREPRDPIEQGRIDSANDPAEAVNRKIFEANRAFDNVVLKPVARAYQGFYPKVRESIHNVAVNVGEPVVLVNDVLQGNIGRALNTTQRFAINTTVGVVGINDVATTSGKPHHYADLGQTFGVWGIAPGPSVQIPILGPSNLRDAFGLATTSLAGTYAFQGAIASVVPYAQMGATAVDDIDYRSKMLPNTDALEKSSQDLYLSIRLIKAQMRARLVEEGKAGRVSPDDASSDRSAGN
ncbi:phospholipid-binding lipoprotein MlaA [Bradyrhizobium erythrophlei]|uniref:Phospholipid-binding lipoprotein MlaA n=1 Tax=Bradyrhizobium erythrophlei TaxID=1437360 RepID=A0A1M7U559_9BRAD|nr:phospholipid-binding lipoprotein MlaA [Bradyrhizobium erythrophlei]